MTALVIPSVSQAGAGVVEGKTVYGGRPVGGVLVYACKTPEGMFTAPPETAPAVTGPDGAFSLTLPRGAYYIAARTRHGAPGGPVEPGDLYCFYGGNPVLADPARPVRLSLSLAAKPAPKPDVIKDGGPGGVEGVVTYNGAPLDGVVIYVYLDANDSFRGLGYYMSPPTGVDGAFRLKMAEGTYYIVARKRLSGQLAGPLYEGDYFGYLDTNPLVIHRGRVMRVEMPVIKKIEKAYPGGQGRTLVSGVIKDGAGRPVPGVYACLYRDAEMTGRPVFISRPTGPDGRFELEAPIGGAYYLGARSDIGRPLDAGQLWGRYDGTKDHKVEVETGKTLDGLAVVVEKVEQ